MPNPYEQLARERKAGAIADFVLAHRGQFLARGISDKRLVLDLAAMSTAARDEVARMAKQESPSGLTWARAVELVEAGIERRQARAS